MFIIGVQILIKTKLKYPELPLKWTSLLFLKAITQSLLITPPPIVTAISVISKVDISMSIISPYDSCLTFQLPVFRGMSAHARLANATLVYCSVSETRLHMRVTLTPTKFKRGMSAHASQAKLVVHTKGEHDIGIEKDLS